MANNILNLSERYSIVHLHKLNKVVIYRDNSQIVWECDADNDSLDIAIDRLANLYLADRDDLDNSYNRAYDELQKLKGGDK
jgi:hypothetical protein